MKKVTALRYALLTFVLSAVLCGIVVRLLRASAAAEVPRVELNTDNIGPRAIEDLTSKSVPRDYAFAWQTMEQALDENRPGLLEGYFTGLAKQSLTDRVNSQLKSGLHTRFTDRGHHLDAMFYSPAGDVMQLRDRAQVDVQVLDGGKVIHEESANLVYTVLMTPGADRWLVREMQAMNGEKP
jgi:hypothetical protein